MILAGCEHQFDGIAQSIDERMYLVVSPPRDRPIACAPFFSSASTVLVSAYDRGVDHVFVVGITRQPLENALENAVLRPSVKALVYDIPLAETRGQITPRVSRSISVKNRINEQSVVCCIAAHMAFSAGQNIFYPFPFVVSQSKALHGRPPQSRLPMNHSRSGLWRAAIEACGAALSAGPACGPDPARRSQGRVDGQGRRRRRGAQAERKLIRRRGAAGE